jgi:hypothetical protein
VAIDEIVKKRFMEGQLDECPLTLKDLTKIKTAFLNVLVGFYHARVKYPEPEKVKSGRRGQEPEAKESDEEQRLSRTIREIDKQ